MQPEKIMEIIKIELDKNKSKIFGRKSAIIWAHTNGNKSFPIIYLRKPKYLTQIEFEEILDRLDIRYKKI